MGFEHGTVWSPELEQRQDDGGGDQPTHHCIRQSHSRQNWAVLKSECPLYWITDRTALHSLLSLRRVGSFRFLVSIYKRTCFKTLPG